VIRTVAAGALQSRPTDDSETIRKLDAGEKFALLEDSLGWAWGYAVSDHRVGYVRSDALQG